MSRKFPLFSQKTQAIVRVFIKWKTITGFGMKKPRVMLSSATYWARVSESQNVVLQWGWQPISIKLHWFQLIQSGREFIRKVFGEDLRDPVGDWRLRLASKTGTEAVVKDQEGRLDCAPDTWVSAWPPLRQAWSPTPFPHVLLVTFSILGFLDAVTDCV